MGQNPVNPLKVTSVMGRGANLKQIGESPHRLEDLRDIGDPQHGTQDGRRHDGHRGTRRVPVYDAHGNLAGIRRVVITGPSDGNAVMRKTSDGLDDCKSHRCNHNKRTRESDRHRIGKTSDGLD